MKLHLAPTALSTLFAFLQTITSHNHRLPLLIITITTAPKPLAAFITTIIRPSLSTKDWSNVIQSRAKSYWKASKTYPAIIWAA